MERLQIDLVIKTGHPGVAAWTVQFGMLLMMPGPPARWGWTAPAGPFRFAWPIAMHIAVRRRPRRERDRHSFARVAENGDHEQCGQLDLRGLYT